MLTALFLFLLNIAVAVQLKSLLSNGVKPSITSKPLFSNDPKLSKIVENPEVGAVSRLINKSCTFLI